MTQLLNTLINNTIIYYQTKIQHPFIIKTQQNGSVLLLQCIGHLKRNILLGEVDLDSFLTSYITQPGKVYERNILHNMERRKLFIYSVNTNEAKNGGRKIARQAINSKQYYRCQVMVKSIKKTCLHLFETDFMELRMTLNSRFSAPLSL